MSSQLVFYIRLGSRSKLQEIEKNKCGFKFKEYILQKVDPNHRMLSNMISSFL